MPLQHKILEETECWYIVYDGKNIEEINNLLTLRLYVGEFGFTYNDSPSMCFKEGSIIVEHPLFGTVYVDHLSAKEFLGE